MGKPSLAKPEKLAGSSNATLGLTMRRIPHVLATIFGILAVAGLWYGIHHKNNADKASHQLAPSERTDDPNLVAGLEGRIAQLESELRSAKAQADLPPRPAVLCLICIVVLLRTVMIPSQALNSGSHSFSQTDNGSLPGRLCFEAQERQDG